MDRADDMTILITGANSGLGFALAVAFAKKGGRVIMAGRSKIPEAGERVRKLSGSDKVEMRYIDLSNLDTIHHFVSSLASGGIIIDICLLNAATALPKSRITPSGQDVRLSVNVICPGPVHSNIVKEAPFFLRMILKGIFRIIFKSPAKAARAVVYMALTADYEGTTNEYLHMFNPKRMDPKVYEIQEG